MVDIEASFQEFCGGKTTIITYNYGGKCTDVKDFDVWAFFDAIVV